MFGFELDLSHSTPHIKNLDDVPGIAQTRFTSRDVVRHPLVGRIVEAYERAGDHVS